MIQQCKIQVGTHLLDGQIDIENGINTTNAATYDLQAEIKRMQSQTFSFSFSVVTPGYEEPNTVEGSITRPITDEGRLLK